MIKNWIVKLWQHKRTEHFRSEFWDAFIKALANAAVGFVLIGSLYLTQKEEGKTFLNTLSNTFEKYSKAQIDISQKLLLHLKTHEAESDSISSKKKKS